ncbi:MAG: hypothetical protein AWU57_477 [Marinobacter sp. T13-3]|nr:MAG: hypothetical protein AWU57_477 [Marinobacter sp. T13-3]
MDVIDQCPQCQGHGTLDQHGRPSENNGIVCCPTCDGDGDLIAERRDFEAHVRRNVPDPCFDRQDERDSYPGQYQSYHLQCMWEGWIGRAHRSRALA